MEKRTEEEYSYRETMINLIEDNAGCYEAVWHEWSTEQIEKLYRCIRSGLEASIALG